VITLQSVRKQQFLTLNSFLLFLTKLCPVSTFALDLMPSFVERINGPEDFEKFKTKAAKYGLPMMLFFSEDRRILNEMKFLSTEFRRRVLVAQLPYTKRENKSIFLEHGVRGQALLAMPPSNADVVEDENVSGDDSTHPVAFDGKWTIHRLQSFFNKHALKSEVKPKPAEDAKSEEKSQQTVKTEL
jgi:hypothetical protein